jgi:hypothetical protein
LEFLGSVVAGNEGIDLEVKSVEKKMELQIG